MKYIESPKCVIFHAYLGGNKEGSPKAFIPHEINDITFLFTRSNKP